MNLQQQVPSLELSKRLKELGVKQESLFAYWTGNGEKLSILKGGIGRYMIEAMEGGDFNSFVREDDYISAPTVAELGGMLPENVCWRGYQKVGGKWGFEFGDFRAEDKTEANARARMMIYLIENELVKL